MAEQLILKRASAIPVRFRFAADIGISPGRPKKMVTSGEPFSRLTLVDVVSSRWSLTG